MREKRQQIAKLKVLFVSPEAEPFARTGGLGDVSGSLPAALKQQGIDVRLILPYYLPVKGKGLSGRVILKDLDVPLGDTSLEADVVETAGKGEVKVYLVEREDLYGRPNLYGDDKGDYYDNLERFSFFSHACLRATESLDFIPHIIHCNDWQTGLVSALLRGPYGGSSKLSNCRVVFTIHNIGYQGIFPRKKLPLTGLPEGQFFHPEGLEYWGNISLLKSGIVYSDAITTVSPRYAEEIVEPDYGMGMEGILKKRRDAIHGILNGIDCDLWDPEKDPHLPRNYSLEALEGKRHCKESLLKEMGLAPHLMDRPLLGMISRMDRQKGFDLLLKVLDRLLVKDVGLIVLGSGNDSIQEDLERVSEKYPQKFGLRWGFDEALSHRIIAGSDVILVPSRYEPCGLTQMYAMRYGCVPLVRATGGLDDTVKELDTKTGSGTGFKFKRYDREAFLEALERAIKIYEERTLWRTLMENGMKEDFSWERSAREYARLYEAIIRGTKM